MTTNSIQSNFSVGFIGGGNMAKSIIGGLVPDIVSHELIHVSDPNTAQTERLAQQFGIKQCTNNHDLISKSDVIVIAVKPQTMPSVLSDIAQDISNNQPLIISIAAGITVSSISSIISDSIHNSSPQADSHELPENQLSIIRVMPNTPALVKSGASGMFANKNVSMRQKQIAEMLMGAVGSALWVEKESDIDSVTALSGSGPAYFMLFIESLINSAEKAGLQKDIAQQLAIDTCIGSAKLIQASEVSIQQLIDNVTSPGGTTEKALQSFKNNQLEAIIDDAFQAAFVRSQELGNLS